ncbi:MAG: hypothetical protein ACYC2Y_05975 [Armatimonadota bacterium]
MTALLEFIAILFVATAFGRRFVGKSPPLERSVFGAGLGLGILAFAVFAAGLARLLYPGVLLGLLVVMALFSVREMRCLVSEIASGLRRGGGKLSAGDAAITLSVAVIGSAALVMALAPPAGTDWDGLAYHLAVPKIYLQHHRILFVPFTSHSNFPFLTEMLYTLGLSISGPALAKLFHFGMYALTAAALYSLGARHMSRSVGKIAALLFMSMPVVFYEAGIAYADLTTAFYVLLGVYAVLNWEESGRGLALCGVLLGFALGTKVLAVIPLAAVCVWVLISSRSLKAAALPMLLALLVGAPWYVKSYVYTGNPVYPFMYEIFGGRVWSDAAAEAYRAEQAGFGMGKGLMQLFMLPWNLLVNGEKFANGPLFGRLIGPAVIGLAPVALLAGVNRKVWKVAAVAAVYVVAWFFLMQHSRYLAAVLPLLALVCAAGVDAAKRWRMGRYLVAGFVGACVLFTLIPALVTAKMAWPGVVGPGDEYLSANLEIYDAEEYLNRSAAGKTVLLDEVRGFYLDRPYIWGSPNHNAMVPWRTFHDGTEMVTWFVERGYANALLNWRYAPSDSLESPLVTDAIGKGLMIEVYASNGVSIYELVVR